ncbi:hypothetical protein CPter291_0896 [Collimonas pratensis]|uniref:Uncharacterized protein n=1 Tax=Collimonas pratensis TaxID=279113 RepID=A0A127Q035_9BURK|nr:hypothetical protein CPter91_0979 [Collimonas pratensis]AMP13174.1 hypothetical protein CPter291_0896 [Collimonas pratensis]
MAAIFVGYLYKIRHACSPSGWTALKIFAWLLAEMPDAVDSGQLPLSPYFFAALATILISLQL